MPARSPRPTASLVVAMLATLLAWRVAWRGFGGDAPFHAFHPSGLVSASMNEGPVYAAVAIMQALAIPVVALTLMRRWELLLARVDAWVAEQLLRSSAIYLVLGMLTAELSLAIAFGALDFSAVSEDDKTLRFQAQLIAHGHLSVAVPAFAKGFTQSFLIHSAGRWSGRFHWAQPALLAVGNLAHLPYLVPAIEAGAIVALGGRLAEAYSGDRRAGFAASAILAMSPVVVLTGATLHDANLSAASCTAGLIALCILIERRSAVAALGLGVAIAVALNTRPLDLLGLSIGATALAVVDRRSTVREKIRRLAPALPAIAIGLAVMLASNQAVSGSPWRSGYSVFDRAEGVHEFGFREGVGGWPHTRAMAAFEAITSVTHLLFYVCGSPWVVALPMLALLAVPGVDSPRLRAPIVIVGGYLAAYVPFTGPHSTVTGPVSELALVPVIAAWIACVAVAAHDALQGAAWSRRLIPAGLLAAQLASLVLFWPTQIIETARIGQASTVCSDLIARKRIDRGLVFVAPSRANWFQTWVDSPPINAPDFDEPVLYAQSLTPDDDAALAKVYAKGRPVYLAACVHDAFPAMWSYDPEKRVNVLLP